MFKKILGILVLAATGIVITGCAATNANDGSSDTPPPSNAVSVSHDLVLAREDRELVQQARFVVHGVPVGEIETVPPQRVGDFTRYYQDVRVLDVLKGQISEETVRAFRPGIDRDELDRFEKAKGVAVFIEDEEQFPGPLSQGPQILFFADKAPTGVYTVVGFRQGAFLLGPDGRVTDAQEFKSFEGLTVLEVKQRIEELSQR